MSAPTVVSTIGVSESEVTTEWRPRVDPRPVLRAGYTASALIVAIVVCLVGLAMAPDSFPMLIDPKSVDRFTTLGFLILAPPLLVPVVIFVAISVLVVFPSVLTVDSGKLTIMAGEARYLLRWDAVVSVRSSSSTVQLNTTDGKTTGISLWGFDTDSRRDFLDSVYRNCGLPRR